MNKNWFLILIAFILSLSTKAQWVKTNGPEGITVSSFFNKDTLLLSGTEGHGVYRSYNSGNSWIVSSQGLEHRWVGCFEKDSTYIYAGTYSEGVFRSSDNGYTWLPSNVGIQGEGIACLLKVDGDLYAGTVIHGLYRSSDQGNTWIAINSAGFGFSYIKAMVYQAPRLMVEADNYIFYSTDTGVTWNIDQGTTQFYQIYDFYQHGDTILAAALQNVFRSTDGGVNWSNPTTFTTSVVGFGQINDTVYAGTAFGVYYSIDWGLSWVQIPASGLRSGASDFVISGTNLLLGRVEKGIAISTDKGPNWTNLPLSQFARGSTLDNSMIFAHDTVYAGTHGNGLFITADQGSNWTKIGTSNQFDTLSNSIVSSLLHVEPNILLAGTASYGLFRSTDNGATWNHIFSGLPQQPVTGNTKIKTLAQCGPNILAATTVGVYYSADTGVTWHYTNLTGTGVLQSGGFGIRDSVACVGIIGFPLQTGVYRSTDYGVTWFLADPILDIEVMATGGNHTMYCGELFTSYVSYDDGLNWQGLGIGAAFSILAWDKYAFIGNNDGVYFSNNYGSSWTLMSQGLDPYPYNSGLGLTRDNVYVYLGTHRDAVWRRPLAEFGITTSIADATLPSEQITVVPNPASVFVKINLPASIKDKYDLSISNAAGQNILSKEISNVDKNTSLSIYVKDLVEGFYTIRINVNDKIYRSNFIKVN